MSIVAASVATCFAAGMGAPVSGSVHAQLGGVELEKRVPGNFVGISIETSGIIPYIGPNGDNSSYAQALRNLKMNSEGPVLRIGGNSADYTCYTSGEVPGCTHNVTDDDLMAYMKFADGPAKDLNLKYVMDTDFGQVTDPETVARHQVETLTRLNMWGYVHQVEIGNEMDIYSHHDHHRNTSYNFQDYMVEYRTFVDSLTRQGGIPNSTTSHKPIIRGAVYASPHNDWADGMEDYVKTYLDVMDSISLHQYPVSYCQHNPNQTVLGWKESEGTVRKYEQFFDIFKKYNLTFVIGEGNSASCSGIPGMSDTFQAALWVMDYLPYLSKTGAEGMNFHGSQSATYTPIAYSSGVLNIRPLYYGLLGFAELTKNHPKWIVANKTQSVPEDMTCSKGVTADNIVCCPAACGTCGGNGCESRGPFCCESQVKALNKSCAVSEAPCVMEKGDDYLVDLHAVHDDAAHEIRILLISKYSTENIPTTVCIDTVQGLTQGTAFNISAPSYHSKYGEGLNYGGQTFDGSTTGHPIGTRRTDPVTVTNGCFTLNVSPFSARLVTLPY